MTLKEMKDLLVKLKNERDCLESLPPSELTAENAARLDELYELIAKLKDKIKAEESRQFLEKQNRTSKVMRPAPIPPSRSMRR